MSSSSSTTNSRRLSLMMRRPRVQCLVIPEKATGDDKGRALSGLRFSADRAAPVLDQLARQKQFQPRPFALRERLEQAGEPVGRQDQVRRSDTKHGAGSAGTQLDPQRTTPGLTGCQAAEQADENLGQGG